jgi:hypothetical protein
MVFIFEVDSADASPTRFSSDLKGCKVGRRTLAIGP